MRSRLLSLVLLFATLAASAATVPRGFIESTVGGMSSPTAMAFAPDGRLFVCEQGGALRVIKDGTLLATPFVTLTVDSNGERGLLGVAFDPAFESNHFLYLYYTATTPAVHNRVSRFTASGDLVVPMSETILMDLDNLSAATNHNGGAIHFGPDGKLYVAVGENANGANAQTLANRLGKMLRINSDGSIPADNPFFNTATGDNRSIWALGLRNPFTFDFQRGTGRLFINDVGESTWEEINDGVAGSNYGWPTTEGMTSNPAFRSPLFVYGHTTSATTGCAIAGGAFYNPAVVQFTDAFLGKYFFADLCSGWARLFDPAAGTATAFLTGASSPVDLHIGPDGSLFYLSHNGSAGRIRSIVASRNRDLNGDGRSDIVWHNDATGSNVVWFMSGTSVALASSLTPVPNPDWKIAGGGDFQDDGRGDVLWRNGVTGNNSLWLMNGGSIALAAPLPVMAPAWSVAAVADLNGDAKVDIVWRNGTTGENFVWLMSGPNVVQMSSLPTVASTQWKIVAAGDFQANGKAGLFWRNQSTGDNAIWLMNGASVASSATLTPVPDTAWTVAGAGDVDGDGDADVVWRNISTGDNVVWFMNGAAITSASVLPAVSDTNWRIVRVSDFQNDGKSDLFWRNIATGGHALWLMNGATVAASAALPSVSDLNWAPAP